MYLLGTYEQEKWRSTITVAWDTCYIAPYHRQIFYDFRDLRQYVSRQFHFLAIQNGVNSILSIADKVDRFVRDFTGKEVLEIF